MLERLVSNQIIGGFFSVYNDMGFGFTEAPYVHAMVVELGVRGLIVRREVPCEIVYRGVTVGVYRFDLVVNDRVIVEVKAGKALHEADERQVLNYLKASRIEVGLLLHFGPRPEFRRLIYTNDRK